MENLLHGILLGAFIFLAATGFCLVRATLGFYNVAHGEFLTFGSYVCFYLFENTNSFLLSATIAVFLTAFLAILIERVFYRPIRQSSSNAMLLTSFGVALVLRAVMALIFSSGSRGLGLNDPAYSLGHFHVFASEIFASSFSLFSFVLLIVIIKKTKFGLAASALGENYRWLTIYAIPVDLIIAFLFAVSGGLAALAGILISWRYTLQLNLFLYTLYAFVIAVVSRGNIPLALMASCVLGVLITLGNQFFGSPLLGEAMAIFFLIIGGHMVRMCSGKLFPLFKTP